MGEIGGIKTRILLDGAAQVNACVSKVMKANPDWIKTRLNKQISSFNGEVVVPANESYELPILTKVPGIFEGNVMFVEVPIQSYDAKLGLCQIGA